MSSVPEDVMYGRNVNGVNSEQFINYIKNEHSKLYRSMVSMPNVKVMSGRRFAIMGGRKMTIKRKVGKRNMRSQFVVPKPFPSSKHDDHLDGDFQRFLLGDWSNQ